MAGRISDIIDIERLEHESRRFLYIGFAVAVLFHALLGVFVTVKRIDVVEERERTIELHLFESRMTEPFVMQKRTYSKKSLHRKTYRYRKPAGSVESHVPPDYAPEYEPTPVDIEVESPDEVIMRDGVDIDLGASRAPDDRIPLKSRILIDPGEYNAEIIYNPGNKHAVQGFVHIPVVKIDDFRPTDTMKLAIAGLADAVNRMTNITAVVDNPLPQLQFVHWNPLMPLRENNIRGLPVDSLHEKRPPLLYILAHRPFELTKAELGSFEIYLKGGGIIVLESGRPGNKNLRNFLRSILIHMVIGPEYEYPEPYPTRGKIPVNHPVYHSFFDFDTVPPEGAGQDYGAAPHDVQPYLEGLWIDNRLVAIYSDFGYGLMWGAESRNREQCRMGVNMVIFALLQQKGYHRGEWYAYR